MLLRPLRFLAALPEIAQHRDRADDVDQRVEDGDVEELRPPRHEADQREGEDGERADRVAREHPEIGRAPSELQSLMRISYAVFCLKKKKHKTIEVASTTMNCRT